MSSGSVDCDKAAGQRNLLHCIKRAMEGLSAKVQILAAHFSAYASKGKVDDRLF